MHSATVCTCVCLCVCACVRATHPQPQPHTTPTYFKHTPTPPAPTPTSTPTQTPTPSPTRTHTHDHGHTTHNDINTTPTCSTPRARKDRKEGLRMLEVRSTVAFASIASLTLRRSCSTLSTGTSAGNTTTPCVCVGEKEIESEKVCVSVFRWG